MLLFFLTSYHLPGIVWGNPLLNGNQPRNYMTIASSGLMKVKKNQTQQVRNSNWCLLILLEFGKPLQRRGKF